MTAVVLKEHERIDQLIREKRQIIQSKQYFSFSLDAVLLADFVRLPERRSFRYLDFCSGNGIIPLLLSGRTSEKLEGIELQEPLVDMAQRSIQLNQLEHQITISQGDINQLNKASQPYDIITCNPPYFLVESSKELHHLTSHQLARHEVSLTMSQWIKKAGVLLRDKGRLYIVHRPERLDDLMEQLLAHQFSVHRIKFAYPKKDTNANIVLIEAIYRGGRHGIRIEPPIIVHDDNHQYTKEMQAIYFGT
ncbi:tRNA1(Val) (adenine(37)-N6)-methyltransferase [Aerococcaceae bacterium zg-ZUI334]|uniref:tRNA1(Val) (adenine(37)-N6)-methyltransferase n=1 Tax=Aerococcaceae bacterium zg-252 TaxID=2796928 RepID=UPI001B8E7FB0|nr:tRNA1(Val) (adenine(37)-N6)-methyltransferase [Aerococcaceae bacterium zg-ZUI334]